jgi:hypothetical protein
MQLNEVYLKKFSVVQKFWSSSRLSPCYYKQKVVQKKKTSRRSAGSDRIDTAIWVEGLHGLILRIQTCLNVNQTWQIHRRLGSTLLWDHVCMRLCKLGRSMGGWGQPYCETMYVCACAVCRERDKLESMAAQGPIHYTNRGAPRPDLSRGTERHRPRRDHSGPVRRRLWYSARSGA